MILPWLVTRPDMHHGTGDSLFTLSPRHVAGVNRGCRPTRTQGLAWYPLVKIQTSLLQRGKPGVPVQARTGPGGACCAWGI